MIAALYIAAFYIVAIAYLAWLAHTAPEGYQDDKGFHFGTARVSPPVILPHGARGK